PPVSPPPVATPADDDVVRITTNLVQVDAVVLDKDGRQVSDLGAEDFEIYEDGRAQKITNLSYVSNEAGAPAPAAPAKTEAADKNAPPAPPVKLRPGEVRRTIALVVDDLGLSFESAYYSRRALKKFVDEQMLPNDLVAIVRTGAGVGALQQFTSDKRMLNAAIERVKFNALGRGGVGAFAPLAGSDPASQTASARGEEERDAGAEGGRDASDELDNFREEIFNVGTLGAVNYVVRGMRELPGRKSIILMSDGFALFRRDDNSRNERTAQALRNLTDLANRASVVIYALDPRGLVSTGLTAADNTAGMTPDQISRAMTARSDTLFETQSGLRYLAEETGGFAVINSNDLSSGVRRVLEDQKGYYLIGYRPQGETFDRRYHKISVKVKRPGLKVRTRTGFYGVTDDNARPVRRTRDEQLLAALTSPFSSGGIDVRLTSLFGDDPKAGSYMRSLMHIDARDLKFTEEADGWRETKLDVLGVAFGDNGRVLEQSGVSHSLKFRGPAYEYILRNGLVFNFNVPVKKGGAYQLRVAVRDAITERVGSASQFVEAPDLKKDRLALSGLVINGLTAAEVAEETKASGQQTAVSTPP
ncbi:MAG: VWA domain-containing protein, partial [Pyrinomonadaceae bacterium]